MDSDYDNYHRDKDYEKMASTFKNIFLTRFKLLNRYIKNGKILEIGSSLGIFLQIFRDHGFEVAGVEPSKSASLAEKKGLKIYKGYFEKLDLPENYFDLIILNHTLEHMGDPEFVLKKVNKLLKKDGLIFVDVPNAGGLGSILMGKYWPYRLPNEHISQFTKQALFSLYASSGFKVIYWQSKSGFFEYSNPLMELKRRSFIRDIVGLPFSVIASLVKMGNSITVIGRKI